ncbi:MAG: hypothetical protein H6508_01465 [Calditrichaeota bacterium]|nr:hypothetical protein [Calditrichota bacterium]
MIVLLLGVLYMVAPRWGGQTDIWETAAAIQAISDSPLDPRNPLLDLPGETSPRFVPYTVIAGLTDRWFDLPLWTTVGIWGILSLLLFVSGLARVVRTLTDDHRAMLWILPVMLLGWGQGYGEANAYQAELFFLTLPYVGMLAYGICFHGLAELNRFLVKGSRSGLVWYILLAVLAFLTHPVTALLLFVAAFAWAVVRKGLVTALLLQVVPLIALGAAALWPYFDYLALLFNGSTEQWYRVRLFDDQLPKLGPVLLGIPVAAYFALRGRHRELVLALGLSVLIYMGSWASGIQIGSRFIFYGAIFSHLCLGLFFLESGVFERGFLKRPVVQSGVIVTLLLLVLGLGTYYRVRKTWQMWKPSVEHYQTTHGDILEPWEDIRVFRTYLDSQDVVMVEDTVGWRFPAVTGARLVAQAKGNPLMIDDVAARRQDVVTFFSGPVTLEERHSLLAKYHCTHILVDDTYSERHTPDLDADLSALAELEYETPPWKLYLIRERD